MEYLHFIQAICENPCSSSAENVDFLSWTQLLQKLEVQQQETNAQESGPPVVTCLYLGPVQILRLLGNQHAAFIATLNQESVIRGAWGTVQYRSLLLPIVVAPSHLPLGLRPRVDDIVVVLYSQGDSEVYTNITE